MAGGIVALDLFAGTGWGVACERLGIEEYGVEVMPEAVAVREANGMQTIYHDVWHGLVEGRGLRAGQPADWYDLLIASPPCQTFSMAGSGAGRRALDEVLAAIDARLYLDPAALVAFGETHDPKTALVLAPLAHIARDVPQYVVLEQVPPVLPVWERYADEMRRWGYSVWTGNLQAEQYGVPQTRRRAILIARADGKEAKAPTPTHSRYHSRDPKKLDEGVKPWVSMAEALGWGGMRFAGAGAAAERTAGQIPRHDDQPAHTITGKNTHVWVGNQVPGGREKGDYQKRDGDLPAPTVTAASRSAKVLRSPQSVEGKGRAEREEDQPSVTVTGNFDRARVMRSNYSAGGEGTAEERGRTMRPDTEPALTMTSKGAQWQEGEDPLVRPAPTVTGGGAATGGAEVFGRHGRAIIEKMRERVNDQTGTEYDPEWPEKRPGLTIATRDLVPHPGHNQSRFDNATKSRNDGVRVTVEEAAALQSYPADFVWDAEFTDPKTGRRKAVTKTNKFLQIGNAVPPGLAEAILREVLS